MIPKIKDYLAAGTPCLFLKTTDFIGAEVSIKSAIKEVGIKYDFAVWKSTIGLKITAHWSGYENDNHIEKSDAISSLSYIEKSKQLILILHNIRQFISNPDFIQKVLDSINYARLTGSHIIFIGSELNIPSELKNMITIFECSLPTREEILNEYVKLTKGYKNDITLPKDKKALAVLLDEAVNSALGLDMMGIENAFALSLAIKGRIDPIIIQKQKEQEIKKSDVLEFVNTDETLETVGGFDCLKNWLKKREKIFTAEAREYGLSYPKGILIVGLAGTGKSLICKAISSYLKLPLIRLDMGSVYASYLGDSEARIRQALRIVDAISPIVLWIDEIERGVGGATNSFDLDAGVSSRVVSTLLTWRQETTSSCFITATANDIESIPTPLLRKGRFDEIWATDLPSREEREDIFKIHFSKRDRDSKNFDIFMLSNNTKGFVGSEIEALIEDAMCSAFASGEEVETHHIKESISRTIPQARRNFKEIEKIRKWVKEKARNVSSKKVIFN